MIAYIDSSVLLRVVLAQPDALPEWHSIKHGVSSRLILTESLRTLDRLRVRARFTDVEVARRRAVLLEVVERLELIDIDDSVLQRAAQPMPTELGTLDAIHLASALLWSAAMRTDLTMATHDAALAVAAQAHGLRVVGSTAGSDYVGEEAAPAYPHRPAAKHRSHAASGRQRRPSPARRRQAG